MTFGLMAGLATAFGFANVAAAGAREGWTLRQAIPDVGPGSPDGVGGEVRLRTEVATPPPSTPVHDLGRTSLMVFGGPLVSARLGKIAAFELEDGVSPAAFVGAAVNREFARWNGFSVEGEVGIGGLIGRTYGTSTPQYWAAGFVRFDQFPWNHFIRTSIAASTGVSYSLRTSLAEKIGEEQATKRLLHYLAPEITFAQPTRPNRELVLRLHHRSSVWGLFGCEACALNVLTIGLRGRF